MKKILLLSLLFSSVSMASGWGGDVEPSPTRSYAKYECINEQIGILMSGYAQSGKEINLESVIIVGIKNTLPKVELISNENLSAARFYPEKNNRLAYVSNVKFKTKADSVSGYGMYMDRNYHILIFSDKNTNYTKSLDIFISDFSQDNRTTSYKVSCQLVINESQY